jgi:hypothetical protein
MTARTTKTGDRRARRERGEKMSAKRNLFVGLLMGLVLGGAISTLLCLQDWARAEGSRTVQLRQGWNQVVWTADNQLADTALSGIAGDLVIAYGWQGDSQTFSRYIPARADSSTMSQLERDSGYWLLLSRDSVLTIPATASECPAPTPCPQCPDATAALAQYQLSETCTGFKLNMELEQITGVNVGKSEPFFNENCQGVSLLRGSIYAEACASAGLVSGGGFGQSAAIQAAALLGQYCIP